MKIVIPIEPKALERPRFTKAGHAYTSQGDKVFKTRFIILCRRAFKDDPYNVPISVSIRFYLKPPARPKFKHYHAVRPDVDNYLKSVFDAANGVLWTDDALIFDVHATKLYDWTGEPRIEIEIMPYGEIKCGAI